MKIKLPLLEALAGVSEATGDKKFDDTMNKIVAGASKKKHTEASVRKLLQASESKLDRAARFKEYDIFMDKKEVQWVTQETSDRESNVAALALAKIFTDNDLLDWTIKVVVRDKYRPGEGTPWKTAHS